MPGPALNQLHAHRAIHDGAQSGAIEYTDLMIQIWKSEKKEDANKAATLLLDYWETRIISHADAEESGFYQKKAENNEELVDAVKSLKRDHEILRIIVKDIRDILQKDGLNDLAIQKFYALLTVNEIHSREEERLLF
ncbi:hypothetical protein SAMN05880501_102283 [Ureibacillus xyleni]|uniref:Hemerythrin HHE cation binding domain-containing protein n=1 Tax=Ureibacillus xyleni TaxID=614648 RepID=A0A285S453_9BACL|nr:hypothetical protein [Ureibacillus xyleni]SOB99869.1 hypothetical protein SAMN05880501_102283 [Ureibacillus xyleni]